MKNGTEAARSSQKVQGCYPEEMLTSNTTINSLAGRSYIIGAGTELTLSPPPTGEMTISSTGSCFYARTEEQGAALRMATSNSIIDQYAYQYQYDDRQRMIAKKCREQVGFISYMTVGIGKS